MKIHEYCSFFNKYYYNDKVISWAEPVARMIQMINACNILVTKSENKTTIGRRRHKWEGNGC
jgi:hypothetical protein